MNFSLVFEHSGDTIPFVALNPEILEYYVNQINQCGLNKFWLQDKQIPVDIRNYIETLIKTTVSVNQWLLPLTDNSISVFEGKDCLDQDNLNAIHAQWVSLQKIQVDINRKRKELGYSEFIEGVHDLYPDSERFPQLGDVITKLNKTKEFDSLNWPLIHRLERSFSRIRMSCSDDWVEFHNPFSKKYVTLDTSNFCLPFNHLGRSQYDKFINFDLDLQHNDENTFNEFLGFVELNLDMPQTKSYSQEYLSWCSANGRTPSGEFIPLGNIPDLSTNLKKYRIMILQNLELGNSIHINLSKG